MKTEDILGIEESSGNRINLIRYHPPAISSEPKSKLYCHNQRNHGTIYVWR